MLVYFVAVLLTCFVVRYFETRFITFPVQGKMTAKQWGSILLASAPLLVVSGCRWGVGTDFFFTYLPEFRALEWLRGDMTLQSAEELFSPLYTQLHNMGLMINDGQGALDYFLYVLEISGPIYKGIMEVSVFLHLGFRGVEWITSAIIEIAVFYCIFTQSKRPVLAAFLYVAGGSFFLSLNIVRQFLAISMGLLAIPCIKDGKWVRYLIFIAIAIMFHTSAVALLPCYLLRYVKLGPVPCFVLIVLALVMSNFISSIFQWLLPKLGLEYYLKYFSSKWNEGFETLFFAINLCYVILGAKYWKSFYQDETLTRLWYHMTVVGTLFLAVSGVVPLMKRINYYYAAPQFLLLPELIGYEKNEKYRKLLVVSVVLLFAAETIVSVCMMNKNGVLPYRIREWY